MKRKALFLFCCFLLFAQLAMPQEQQPAGQGGSPPPAPGVDAPKPAELTELENLKVTLLLKEFTIAQLQRQVATTSVATTRTAFWNEVKRLFKEKGISEITHVFDTQTMRFEPKPAEEEKKENKKE